MKVYACVEYDYDGSNIYRICKNRKKAEYIVKQVNRLFDVYRGLFNLRREIGLKYWTDNPQLIDSTRSENSEYLPEVKKIDKLLDKVKDVLELFGADSFFTHSLIEEKKLE